MAHVSILIPAYRADFIAECVASALSQTFQDFEIIISDDCPTDAVECALSMYDDPRIRYFRNPTPRRYATNRDNLLRLAQGRYLKFLFDDDYLYPRSIEILLDAITATGAKMAFHLRHHVDRNGKILFGEEVIPQGQTITITPTSFCANIIGRGANLIGEPSNTLLESAALRSIERPFEIEGRPSRFLGDVAMYYGFARQNFNIAGVGEFGSAFRQHGDQTSNLSSPAFAAGIFEWELLARSARSAEMLSEEAYSNALQAAHSKYRRYSCNHPILSRFLDIDSGGDQSSALSMAFLRTLDLAYFDVGLRQLERSMQR